MKPVNDHELKLMIQTRPTEVFAYIKDLQKRLHWAENENESLGRLIERQSRIITDLLEEKQVKNFPDHCDG